MDLSSPGIRTIHPPAPVAATRFPFRVLYLAGALRMVRQQTEKKKADVDAVTLVD